MKDINGQFNVEIKVDESIAEGRFCNFINISNSMEEFIFDFLFVNPSPAPGYGKLISRMILTPGHAKRLLNALGHNLHEYELRFGEIKTENTFEVKPTIQ